MNYTTYGRRHLQLGSYSDISYYIIIIDTNRTTVVPRLPNRTIIVSLYYECTYIWQAAFLSERPVRYVRPERTSFSLHTATIIRRPTSVLFPDDHDDDDYNNMTAYAYTDLYAYRKTVVMLGRYVGKLNMWALRRVRMRPPL